MFSNFFRLVSALILILFVSSSFAHDYHIESHDNVEERILCQLYQNNIDTSNAKLEVKAPHFSLLTHIDGVEQYQYTPVFSSVTPYLRAPPSDFS